LTRELEKQRQEEELRVKTAMDDAALQEQNETLHATAEREAFVAQTLPTRLAAQYQRAASMKLHQEQLDRIERESRSLIQASRRDDRRHREVLSSMEREVAVVTDFAHRMTLLLIKVQNLLPEQRLPKISLYEPLTKHQAADIRHQNAHIQRWLHRRRGGAHEAVSGGNPTLDGHQSDECMETTRADPPTSPAALEHASKDISHPKSMDSASMEALRLRLASEVERHNRDANVVEGSVRRLQTLERSPARIRNPVPYNTAVFCKNLLKELTA
jgi:hypothetical protein